MREGMTHMGSSPIISVTVTVLNGVQEQTFFLFVSWSAVHRVERKLSFTGQVESTDGQRVHLL